MELSCLDSGRIKRERKSSRKKRFDPIVSLRTLLPRRKRSECRCIESFVVLFVPIEKLVWVQRR